MFLLPQLSPLGEAASTAPLVPTPMLWVKHQTPTESSAPFVLFRRAGDIQVRILSPNSPPSPCHGQWGMPRKAAHGCWWLEEIPGLPKLG